MGSRSLALLCEAILDDHFGFYVSTVGRVLLKGSSTLRQIHRQLHGECKSTDIKKSLAILELHDLIAFKAEPRGVVYTIRPDEVVRFLRFPRLLQIVERTHGKLEAKILGVLLLHGRLSFQQCADMIVNEQNNWLENDIAIAFKRLALEMLLGKAEVVVTTDDVPVLIAQQNPSDFNPPAVSGKKPENPRKHKLATEQPDDWWRVNWNAGEKVVRDEVLLDLIKLNPEYKPKDELYWRTLLKIGRLKSQLNSLASDTISISEVAIMIKEERGTLIAYDHLNSAFLPLTNPRITFPWYAPIIRRLGESAGGLYVIDYQAAFAAACYDHVETVIRERIDDRAVRIFRVICYYRNVEEEELSKMVMLATKEAKGICHLMLESGYIYMRPIAKSNDFAPSRTFYFYTHKLTDLISMMSALSYDSLRNVICRRLEEVRKNGVLIDARRKIDTVVSKIKLEEISLEDKEAQAQEVEAMYMTEEDNRKYQRYLFGQRRLCATEVGLEQALFVFQMCNLFDLVLSLEAAVAGGPKRKRKPVIVI